MLRPVAPLEPWEEAVCLLGFSVFFFVLPVPRTPSLQLIALGLPFVVWLARCVRQRGFVYRPSPVWCPFLVWLVLTGGSVLFSLNEKYSLRQFRRHSLMILAVVFLLLFHVSKGRHLRWYLYVWLAGIYGVAGYQIAKYALGMQEFVLPSVYYRVQSYFGHYDQCATYLSMSLPVAMAVLVGGRRWERLFAAGALALGGAVQLMTFSRAGWLSVVLVGLVMAVVWVRWLLAGLVVAGVGFATVLPPDFVQRATSASIGDRWHVWRAGIQMAVEHPWFGIGLGNRNFASLYPRYLQEGVTEGILLNAHNLFIQLAAETGFPAMFAFVAVMLTASFIAVRSIKRLPGEERLLPMAALGSLLGYTTHSLFAYHFERYEGLLFAVALAIVCALNHVTTEHASTS